jgi:hypothetical protein
VGQKSEEGVGCEGEITGEEKIRKALKKGKETEVNK